jgi:hypothetical protein
MMFLFDFHDNYELFYLKTAHNFLLFQTISQVLRTNNLESMIEQI